jgi:hypothetical protein
VSQLSHDAWWTRSPSETSTSLEVDDVPEPPLEIIDAAGEPVEPVERSTGFETTVLSRRRLRQIRELHRSRQTAPGRRPLRRPVRGRPVRGRPVRGRPVRPLLAAVAAALARGSAGAGVALALRPDPEASGPAAVAATRAVPVDRAAVSARASSTQSPEGDITYAAANTLDGDVTTAWNSNGTKDGKGPGIALTYTFTAPVALRDLTIRNGYQKVRPRPGRSALDLYPLNARVQRLRVVTDAGAWLWDVADTRSAQTFTRAAGRTGSVRLEIVSVYPSATYPDVALSEVSFTSSLPR